MEAPERARATAARTLTASKCSLPSLLSWRGSCSPSVFRRPLHNALAASNPISLVSYEDDEEEEEEGRRMPARGRRSGSREEEEEEEGEDSSSSGSHSPAPSGPSSVVVLTPASEERRAKLRELEVKVVKYQDDLEAGRRSRKPEQTLAQQVEAYRRKLYAKESRHAERKHRHKRKSAQGSPPPPGRARTRTATSRSRSPARTNSGGRHRSEKEPERKGAPGGSTTGAGGSKRGQEDRSDRGSRSGEHNSGCLLRRDNLDNSFLVLVLCIH